MTELIDFDAYPVSFVKRILLQDKATKQNIIWATSSYEHLGYEYSDNSQIQEYLISGINKWIVQPRVEKNTEQQQRRTRTKAEVFTPSWICNKMNNLADEQWFCWADIFNMEINEDWQTNTGKIKFPEGKNWKKYVDLRVLEITCGEAPYLCSRYDTSTGQIIPISNRIGILDRKMRVINENTNDEDQWYKWVIRAFQSCYGYEYQGDNLIIARINMLLSFYEYYMSRWKAEPTKKQLRKIANIISWNLWQMDGLKGTVPSGVTNKVNEQLRIYDLSETQKEQQINTECYLRNWRADRALYYSDLKGVKRKMKFDFAIGNPPYQEENSNNNRQSPIYNVFIEESYSICNCAEFITPARFLFNAGQTPKQWNKKMLNDEHFKVLMYEKDSSKIFDDVDIKGGVAISLRSQDKVFGKIGVFTTSKQTTSIIEKVKNEKFIPLSSYTYPKSAYGLSDKLYNVYPELKTRLTKGNSGIIDANIFGKMPEIFVDNKNDTSDYIKVYGRQNNSRIAKWIRSEYIKENINLNKYKVLIAGANGTGKLGETLSQPEIGEPNSCHTQTFISIGSFNTYVEAINCVKYIKTKFLRLLLGTLKVTQNNPKETWSNIPFQDFTENSDIDWSKSIHEIDLQLYKKYGLDDTEIEFIEKNVKEMS